MRKGALIAGLVALLAVAGCGGEDESPADQGEPGGASLAGPVTYSRGGGIAGRTDKLVVQPDGSGSLTTRSGGERAVKLEPSQMRQIADGVERPTSPAARGLDRRAGPAGRLRVPRLLQGATVRTESGSIPERMGPLVGALGEIVDDLDRPRPRFDARLGRPLRGHPRLQGAAKESRTEDWTLV